MRAINWINVVCTSTNKNNNPIKNNTSHATWNDGPRRSISSSKLLLAPSSSFSSSMAESFDSKSQVMRKWPSLRFEGTRLSFIWWWVENFLKEKNRGCSWPATQTKRLAWKAMQKAQSSATPGQHLPSSTELTYCLADNHMNAARSGKAAPAFQPAKKRQSDIWERRNKNGYRLTSFAKSSGDCKRAIGITLSGWCVFDCRVA